MPLKRSWKTLGEEQDQRLVLVRYLKKGDKGSYQDGQDWLRQGFWNAISAWAHIGLWYTLRK